MKLIFTGNSFSHIKALNLNAWVSTDETFLPSVRLISITVESPIGSSRDGDDMCKGPGKLKFSGRRNIAMEAQ